MIKNIILINLIFFNFFCAKAQLNDNSATILKGVSDKTKTYSTIKINFSFITEKDGKTIEVKKGDAWVKGKKYIYNFNKQIIVSDGITQWTYIVESNEVSISNVNDGDETLNPALILNNYSKKYRPKLIKETLEKGKIIQVVDLYPLKGKSYSKVRLNIDKAKKQILKMSVYEKEGTIYTYLIDKFIVNQLIDDAKFSFNAKSYPGIDINDMR